MSNAYDFWLSNVKRQLVHPDALLCTTGPAESVLPAFFEARFTARRVARQLNDRYNTGFLERKRAMKAGQS